jgi:hypothetical protein
VRLNNDPKNPPNLELILNLKGMQMMQLNLFKIF